MTWDISDTPFDLGQIFIAREQQIDLFNIYLDRWKQLMFDTERDDTYVTTAPSPHNKIQGLMILLYGRGGFGKSTLLKHYHALARQDGRNLIASKIIDWEFAIEGKRGIFAFPQNQEVDASEYYRVVCGQLAIALDKKPKEFREYQSVVQDVEKARKQASGVLDRMQSDDRYAALRGVTIDALVMMIGAVTPGSVSKILDNEKVKGVANQGIKVGVEQLAHVHAKLRDELGDTLGDYLDSPLRLGLALGRDLFAFARNFPLLICFDTYEEIASADHLLRTVMGAAGLRVGWVLAGRDNLWGGSEQRKRSIAKEYGYKEIVPADRALTVDFNVGGVGGFTLSDIQDYFEQLCQRVPYEPPLPMVTEDKAARILGITQGIPLAVNIAAGLYIETADLELITENIDSQRKIVDQMVERYLLHARDDQSERAKLYGLAMLRRADQPSAISAALNLTAEQAEKSYERELSRLHRRYSFIFTEKEAPSLHQEVRSFLRSWLLERYQDPEIVAVNEWLKEAHEAALKMLEDQWKYSSLKARFEDEKWIEKYLDLTEQQFWLNPAQGVAYALPLMLTASIHLPYLISTVVQLGNYFAAVLTRPHRDWWTWARQGLGSTAYASWPTSNPFLSPLESVDKWGGH